MREEFLIFGSPQIQEDEVAEVEAVVRSGWLGTGPKVHQFETDFSKYTGAEHCAAVNSCTAAIHLALVAAGLQSGDEVITTPMTFCASVNAIVHSGATPVLADVDPTTMNIDPAKIAEKITSKTKAILPVHFAGRVCDMKAIMQLADQHNLKVIEDCAHSIEAEYHGRKAGTFGDFGCFSFYVTKNVATGEGGMVISRTEKDHNRIKQLALHGMSRDAWKRFGSSGYSHYQVVECGFKYNMMDLQAAIGIHQLARVEANSVRREEIWNRYMREFAGLPITLPAPVESNSRHAYHLYTVLVDEQKCGLSRDTFLEKLKENNIGAGVHYQSIPEHPVYQQNYGWRPQDYPHAYYIGQTTVSLPFSAALSNDDVSDVIDAVKKVLK